MPMCSRFFDSSTKCKAPNPSITITYLFLLLLFSSLFFFFFTCSAACFNGNCQVIEACSASADCGAGLYCGNCPALRTTQPLCTRGQTTLPTSLLAMAKNDVEITDRGSFSAKDYHDPPPAPLIDAEELTKWSFFRALIAEFIATLLFLYITVLTVIGYKSQSDVKAGGDVCGGVGILGIAWAFGGINPARSFGAAVIYNQDKPWDDHLD